MSKVGKQTKTAEKSQKDISCTWFWGLIPRALNPRVLCFGVQCSVLLLEDLVLKD